MGVSEDPAKAPSPQGGCTKPALLPKAKVSLGAQKRSRDTNGKNGGGLQNETHRGCGRVPPEIPASPNRRPHRCTGSRQRSGLTKCVLLLQIPWRLPLPKELFRFWKNLSSSREESHVHRGKRRLGTAAKAL